MYIIVNFSLLMRVNALWSFSRPVVCFATLLFALNTLCQIIVLAYCWYVAILMPNVLPFTGCIVIVTFPKTYLIFIAGIAYETCMVALTIIRSWPVARGRDIKLPLWSLLLQDGLIYYLFIIAAQIFVTIVMRVPVDISISVLIMLSYSPIFVVGIACNRLFIRLEMLLQGVTDEEDSLIVSARIRPSDDPTHARNGPRAFEYYGGGAKTPGSVIDRTLRYMIRVGHMASYFAI